MGLRILSGRSACAYFRGVLSPPEVCAQLPISQTNQGGWVRCHLRLVWKRSRGDGLSQRYSTNPPEEVARLRLAGTGSRGMLHRPAGWLALSPPCKHEENQQLPRRAGPGVWAMHFRNCRCGLVVKNPPVDARHRRHGLHPWIGTIPGEGNDDPSSLLQEAAESETLGETDTEIPKLHLPPKSREWAENSPDQDTREPGITDS